MHLIKLMRVLMALAICHALAVLAALGQEPEMVPGTVPETATDRAGTLGRAHGLIKQAEYDEAIKLLREEIERSRGNLDELRGAYLLLIETYTIRGNSYRFEDPTAAELYYKEARATIRECLEIHELRHTTPVPASDYTPETRALFEQVRNEMFGSFVIRRLKPSDAVVVLGAYTLSARADGVVEESDIPQGSHLLVVRSMGFRTHTEEIVIAPGATVDRSYELTRNRPWYKKPWVYAVAAGVVASAVVVTSDGSGNEPEPLGGPPPPPGN